MVELGAGDVEHRKIALGAASLRVILGTVGLIALPIVYPKSAAHRWAFLLYLVLSAASLPLVWKQIGGKARTVASGVLDLAILTFIVQRLGSAFTVLAVIYLLLSILNVTIVGKREGMIIAALGSLMYLGVIGAEVLGWLSYAPDSPHWAIVHPSHSSMLTAGMLVATVNVLATWMVSILVERIRTREIALEEANRQLAELSQHDPLTQLYNRRHLLARIEAELARVRRGHPMALLMIDLDGFKRVNDERGHLAGDEVLTKMADALARATRATDVAGRYGGDEFVVVLPDADVESARVAAERLLEEIRKVGLDGGLSVTGSVGLAVASQSDSLTDLLRRADEAAYRAKQAGGDRLELAP